MIYLDSCVLIYAVEDDGELGAQAREALALHPDEVFVTSQIARMECLVAPLRKRNVPLEDQYERFFEQLEIVTLTDRVFHRAADLRARNKLKSPDALHLAVAQIHGCTALWTNDARFAAAVGDFAINIFEAI